MECDWVVGDEVECFKAIKSSKYGEICPKIGGKYKIREIFGTELSGVRINLIEISNIEQRYHDGFYECGFDVKCFRKLQTKKTDISIFKSMLNKSPEQNKREHNESKVRDALQEFAH